MEGIAADQEALLCKDMTVLVTALAPLLFSSTVQHCSLSVRKALRKPNTVTVTDCCMRPPSLASFWFAYAEHVNSSLSMPPLD